MRVVAGRFGGRRLQAPKGDGTRPTSDRVREALFSILGDLTGARVLDLFAGTGALGIEALSRGAAHATFVERDRRALDVLRANLSQLGLEPGESVVHPVPARRALQDAARSHDAYDLALLDPPYRLAADLGPELTAPLRAVLAPGARVVAESDRRSPLRLEMPEITQRRYGDTLLTLFEVP